MGKQRREVGNEGVQRVFRERAAAAASRRGGGGVVVVVPAQRIAHEQPW